MYEWLVRFTVSWWDEDEIEIVIKAPRLWEVSKVLQEIYPGAILKGVAWIMPELELEEE